MTYLKNSLDKKRSGWGIPGFIIVVDKGEDSRYFPKKIYITEKKEKNE